MKTQYITVLGKIVPFGVAVTPDHHEDTFTVNVSSLKGVTAEDIKALIQQKYEVLSATHDNKCVIVKG